MWRVLLDPRGRSSRLWYLLVVIGSGIPWFALTSLLGSAVGFPIAYAIDGYLIFVATVRRANDAGCRWWWWGPLSLVPYANLGVLAYLLYKPQAAPLPLGNSQDTGYYGTLDEFREGISMLLSTTLVLNDDTRVKMLALEWAGLPADYRNITLAAVRKVAEVELSDHPKASIRFEFSEIPADLKDVMEGLIRTNPRLSYEQVDMGKPTKS